MFKIVTRLTNMQYSHKMLRRKINIKTLILKNNNIFLMNFLCVDEYSSVTHATKEPPFSGAVE